MNKQPITKQNLNEKGYLKVVNIFRTIQGEGPFAGIPAVFIRLAGCNLQCPMCDTDYTSDSTLSEPEFILNQVQELIGAPHLVVITGGEPFRQNLTPLVKLLIVSGFDVQIETNGTLYLQDFPYRFVTVVCSPKTGGLNKKLLKHISAYKYVLSADAVSEQDGLPIEALGHIAWPEVARPPLRARVFLQPVDTGDKKENERHLKATIDSCLTFGHTLGLQLHKIINME